MKAKLFTFLCSLILLCSLIFSGCQKTYSFSLAQSMDNIDKVEICAFDYLSGTTTPLVLLDRNDAKSLLTEVCTLKCKRHFGDHTMDYGEIVIYVSYIDKTAEIIGLWNVAQVTKDGEWFIGIEYFDAKQLCSLIVKYVDVKMLPDLSQYFE